VASPADDVVVMVLTGIDLVPVGAVTEVATTEHANFLHCGEGSIDGDEIAFVLSEAFVQFLRGERTVFAAENTQHRAPRSGNAVPV
jgi:hypothetical protein